MWGPSRSVPHALPTPPPPGRPGRPPAPTHPGARGPPRARREGRGRAPRRAPWPWGAALLQPDPHPAVCQAARGVRKEEVGVTVSAPGAGACFHPRDWLSSRRPAQVGPSPVGVLGGVADGTQPTPAVQDSPWSPELCGTPAAFVGASAGRVPGATAGEGDRDTCRPHRRCWDSGDARPVSCPSCCEPFVFLAPRATREGAGGSGPGASEVPTVPAPTRWDSRFWSPVCSMGRLGGVSGDVGTRQGQSPGKQGGGKGTGFPRTRLDPEVTRRRHLAARETRGAPRAGASARPQRVPQLQVASQGLVSLPLSVSC